MKWSAELVARILELNTLETPVSLICKELGLTKGQVIGKLHNLGRKAGTPAGRAKSARNARRRAPVDGHLTNFGPCTIVEARSDQCRWPLDRENDDGRPLFCGEKVEALGMPWCSCHLTRATASRVARNELLRRSSARAANNPRQAVGA